MKFSETNKKELKNLCKEFNVKELYLFGSAISDKFHKGSDLDFLVEFSKIELLDYLNNYVEFKKSLRNLFNRKIDLVEKQAINNPILRRSIDRHKQKIYG